jgi:hypothetical protein
VDLGIGNDLMEFAKILMPKSLIKNFMMSWVFLTGFNEKS